MLIREVNFRLRLLEKYMGKPMIYVFQKIIGYTVFKIVCAGIDVVSKHDKSIQGEMHTFPEGVTLGFSTGFGHKAACVQVQNGQFKLITKEQRYTPDILITFKSMKFAFKIILGMESVQKAYLNYRVSYEGDLMLAARVIRIVDRVESYLFPDCIVGRLLGNVPAREISKWKIYSKVGMSLMKGGLRYEQV